MSNLNPAQLIERVHEQKDRFTKLDMANGRLLDFTQECLFARQQLLKNNKTLEAASKNPNSLQAAILNVAAIGISLNPATAHAYLVPRDGAICLDISFRGLVKIATDSGSIKWAKVELVYESDTFEWLGPSTVPVHRADPFAPKDKRGAMIGGYCIAKLPDGDTLIETMGAEQIYKIRNTSKAYKTNSGPWVDWPDEMAKKTIIKRAYKSWPQTPNRIRLDRAVETLHESEGTAFTIEQQGEYLNLLQNGDAVGMFLFTQSLKRENEQALIALYNNFEPGQKVENKKRSTALENAGREMLQEWAANLTACVTSDDAHGVAEIMEDMTPTQTEAVLALLNNETITTLEQMRKAA